MLSFYESFKNAKNEEDVKNNGWLPTINSLGKVNHHFEVSGIDDLGTISLPYGNKFENIDFLCETKFSANLGYYKDRNKVLAQVITYLYRIANSSDNIEVPKVIILCDNSEIAIINTNSLKPFFEGNYNFTSLAASQMYNNTKLMDDLNINFKDKNVSIIHINSNTNTDLSNAIISSYKEQKYQNSIKISNLISIFNKYSGFLKIGGIIKNENDRVGIFIGLLTDKANFYQHPTCKNIIITPNGKISVDPKLYKEFTDECNIQLKASDQDVIIAARDIIVEDSERREKGQFYTPAHWAQHAINLCEQKINPTFRQDYVVWDCCCGTKALTRMYDDWGNLFCSTSEKSEIDNSARYNSTATSFTHDFLDGDRNELVKKAPGLLKALRENKPILFLINPPYGTAGNYGSKKNEIKSNINKRPDKTINEFKEAGFKSSCENIYMQFLERICWYIYKFNLTNVKLCLFSPTTHLTGIKQSKFRETFFKYFNFDYGCKFNASEFSGTSSTWDISLSIYSSKTSSKASSSNNNCFYNYDNVKFNGNVVTVSTEKLKNTDNLKDIRKWLKESDSKRAKFAAPSFSSGLKNKSYSNGSSMLKGGCFGYIIDHQAANSSSVIFSSGYSDSHGKYIYKDNFYKIITTFLIRRSTNGTDAVLAPNESNPKWNQFVNDCLPFAIFDNNNNATSLRNVEYQPPKNMATISDSPNVHYDGNDFWTINNPWLPLSKDEIMAVTDTAELSNVYNEARSGTNSFVYDWMQGRTFSPEAQKVLDLGKKIILDSFAHRAKFDEDHPEYQIMNWDCGWYQVKAVAKEYMKDQYEEFDEAFKELKKMLVAQIYDLGFLIKD